ncbi:MAG: hypothetical protein OQK55_09490 [Thermoanaerobaculales bacterium]|nr:hypothetical protein [Thermoanaerobaculales bacterium]
MRERVFFTLMAASLAFFGCGGDFGMSTGGEKSSQAAIDEAYGIIDALYDNEASDEEKLAATVEFLEAYPETDHTVGLVGDVFYFTGEKAGDMNGAVEFAEKIRSAVTDSTIAMDFDRRLISWYGEAGMKARMLAIADRFEQQGTIRFGDYFNVIESAVAMEEWALAREYCSKAQPKANAATWKAEWPDIEATDERAEEAGLNRQGMLLVKDSWARAKLGDVEGALAGFTRADEIVDRSYVGIPGYDLNLYWGRAYIMTGDAAGAMEKFAPDALIVGDDDAAAALRQAYAMVNESDDDFVTWSCRKRLEIAKKADDFELPDSSGARHRFTDLRGEATLLNIWSST